MQVIKGSLDRFSLACVVWHGPLQLQVNRPRARDGTAELLDVAAQEAVADRRLDRPDAVRSLECSLQERSVSAEAALGAVSPD